MSTVDLEAIKQRRKEMHITLQEMAESLGYSDASSYYRYEKGIYHFNANQLPIVCEKLKLEIKDIFFAKHLLN